MADKSSGLRAIEYAENKLGVDQVMVSVLDARARLDATLTELSEKRDARRNFEETLNEAELNVAADERTKHPDMSQAQMDKHVKVAIQKDTACAGIRAHLREIAGDIDGLECDKDIAEADIKIYTARMIQLGGYLNYLAVAKQTNTGGGSASTLAKQSPIPGW